MEGQELSPEVLSPRQSRALSVWEDYLEKHIKKDKLEPESKLQRFDPHSYHIFAFLYQTLVFVVFGLYEVFFCFCLRVCYFLVVVYFLFIQM